MKISVIIPTYERYTRLKKCVTSILNKQWIINYEIIIVYSNKTGKIKEYLNTLKDNNCITMIYQKPNGACKSFITGIEHANSKYCLGINDDCYLIDNKVIDKACYEMDNNHDIANYGIKNIDLRYPNVVQFGGRTICGFHSNHYFIAPTYLLQGCLKPDPIFYTYGTDADLFYRTVLFGFTVKESNDVGILHDHIPREHRSYMLFRKHRADIRLLHKKWGSLLRYEHVLKNDNRYMEKLNHDR